MNNQQKLSKKQPALNTEEESTLYSLYMSEFNDCFPTILSIPAVEFLSNLTKGVEYINSKKFNDFSEQTKTKVEEYFMGGIFPTEYKIAFSAMRAIKKKLKANPDYFCFKGTYTQHCSKNTKPIHSCGNSLYLFTFSKLGDNGSSKESFLLCPDCDEIYKSNFVKFYCDECKVNFYSKINCDTSLESKYQLATWENYHCKVMINDCMKCVKCKSPFYLDSTSNNKMLTCLKCNTSIMQDKLLWKCVLCQEQFHAEAKPYNPLEYKNMKLSIKEAMINKEKAKPECVGCCSIDMNQFKFLHNTKCKGELFLGRMNGKKIIVCSKCESVNNYENYRWTCPNCEQRLVTRAKSNQKIQVLGSRGKSQNRIVFRYDSGIKLKTEANKNDNVPSPLMVSTPFELVRDRKRMLSLKKNHENILSSSAIKSPREILLRSSNPLCRSNYKSKEFSLCKSPLNPIKLNLANKFLKMKMPNFEEDISVSIVEDIVKENEITRKIIKENSNGNLFTTESSYEQSDRSNGSTLKSNDQAEYSNQIRENEIKQQYPQFEVNEYNIIKQIGVGAFGKIYMAEAPNKELVAIKKIVGASMEELQSLKIEYEILLSLHKKNSKLNLVRIQAIQTKQLDQTTYVMYVLMELAERDWEKELVNRSKNKSYYTEKELVDILSTLVKTFAYLQRHNISHRDIKPQNILLFDSSDFKLADFGEAKILQSDMPDTNKQTLRGTELYMSPILFKALRNRVVDFKYVDHNTYKSDVFSFGLCALYAATLTFQSLYEIREVYDMARINTSISKYLSVRYSQGLVNILIKMLDINEKSRCDFLDLEKVFDNYCI